MYRVLAVRLYPTGEQEATLHHHLELSRLVYNAAVEQRLLAWSSKRPLPNYYDQARELPQLKAGRPEFAAPSSFVLQTTLFRVHTAFQRYLKGITQRPRFRRKGRFVSFVYPAHRRGCYEFLGSTMTFAKIGTIPCRAGRPPRWLDEKAIAKSCSLKRIGTRWIAYVRYLVPDPVPQPLPPEPVVVGLDVGVEKFLTLSDGTMVANPRFFSRMNRRLVRLQRRYDRRKPDSKNKEKARRAISALYERARCRRLDFHHKVSRRLADGFDIVAVEDNLSGLYRGMLAKQIYDVGWGQFRRLLEYKLWERGKRLIPVAKFESSQRCSSCGARVPKELKVRVHRCPCGLTLDRDVNAALNLRARALQQLPRDSGEVKPVETERFRDDVPVPV